MKLLKLLIVVAFLGSCNQEDKVVPRTITEIEIQDVLLDSLLNIRALEVNERGVGLFATSNGKIGSVSKNKKGEVSGALSVQIMHDSIVPNFRALEMTGEAGFLLGIESPALLYKIDEDSLKLVYKEEHPKSFYNSLAFWNDDEGIAIGDPTDSCMSIIITRDGGDTWSKIKCEELPEINDGEAAFAASDTNIAIIGDRTWVATGGKSSRVLFSEDKGDSWQVFETPIIQGKTTTGIYSIDFFDDLIGFAIGGDYTNPTANETNKINTEDGGKTWQVVAPGEEPGYRSCVQYVPNRKGEELIAVGFNGIDFSSDSGLSWKHLSDEGFYTLRFVNDSIAYAAGKGRLSKLILR